jgi:FAD/FMN-containing dehydrogenase
MDDRKAELAAIAGQGNVLDTPEILELYASDRSFAPVMLPRFVVKPENADVVHEIIGWANKTHMPLVPVSSGPPHFRGDTVPSVREAVIVDLSGMNRIININRRNRLTIIEPGVTYGQLMPALAKEGLLLSTSLLPRANKSVITSLLEREPRLNCNLQWVSLDPLRCLEIIWGDGNRLWTGDAGMGVMDLEEQWNEQRWPVSPAGPGQTDFYRFVSAAQGSMGIATWASVRCEVLPRIHKLYFVPAGKLEDLTDFTYRLLRYRYADELFIMNSTNLARAVEPDSQRAKALGAQLPPWVVIVGIAGRDELPEERVDFQEKDISDIVRQFSLEMVPELPGLKGTQLLEKLLNPSGESSWKLDYKGDCQDIFFISTLDQAPEFIAEMDAQAGKSGYPTGDIGVYLQPRHQGVNCHCEFTLPYNPNDAGEVSRIQALYKGASEAMVNHGAFFTRPYGIWADMAFERDPQSTYLLQKVKGIFDPNDIMNPGKLCFKSKETEAV